MAVTTTAAAADVEAAWATYTVEADSTAKQRLSAATTTTTATATAVKAYYNQEHNKFTASWSFLEAHRAGWEANYPALVKRLVDPSPDVVHVALDVLANHVRALLHVFRARQLPQPLHTHRRNVEKLLVSMTGHFDGHVRMRVSKLLNMLYDGHDWQMEAPFQVEARSVGDELSIAVPVSASTLAEHMGQPLFLLCGPPTTSATADSTKGTIIAAGTHCVVTAHAATIVTAPDDTGARATLALSSATLLSQAGFYDWRLVVQRADGTLIPVHALSTSATAADDGGGGGDDDDMLSSPSLAQGRAVVFPTTPQQLVEVVVDLENMQYSSSTGEIARRGTFQDVAARLEAYKKSSNGGVVLVGALDRDNGMPVLAADDDAGAAATATPAGLPAPSGTGGDEWGFYDGGSGSGSGSGAATTAAAASVCPRPDASMAAVTCRRTPNLMLGGPRGFSSVVTKARELDVSLLVQFPTTVAAARHHRRYASLLARVLDADGRVMRHAGTDGRENQWEDQVLLNYRLLATWELLVSDLRAVAAHGATGVLISDCQSLPLVMALDSNEMYRLDADGSAAHTDDEVLRGDVVLPNEELGFWECGAAQGYANPILAKAVREVWASSPDFVMLGDCHWGRAGALARSGIVPRTSATINALAATNGRTVSKNGAVGKVSPSVARARGPVAELNDMLARELRLPEGVQARQVRSICTARVPFPALLLGRGAWTAVDVAMCLPGVPMLFAGEDEGKAYRVGLNNVYQQDVVNPYESAIDWRRRRMRAASSVGGGGGLGASGGGGGAHAASGVAGMVKSLSNTELANTAFGHVTGLHAPLANAGSFQRARGRGSTQSLSALPGQGGGGARGGGGGGLDLDDAQDWFFGSAGDAGAGLAMGGAGAGAGAFQGGARSGSWEFLNSDRFSDSGYGDGGGAGGLVGQVQQADNDDDTPRRTAGGIPEVASWTAMPSQRTTLVSLSNSEDVKDLAVLEARLRKRIGPEYGFDLARIKAHYAHRISVRQALPVLQRGSTVLLHAYHRYGQHDNVFTFARVLPGEIAVVACNFNSAPSTFWVDTSPLADQFLAEPASRTDAVAETLLADDRSTTVVEHVWEESDAFKNQAHLRIMIAQEAAYSCRVTTLQPQASMCWLFKKQDPSEIGWELQDATGATAATAATDAGAGASAGAGSGAGAGAGASAAQLLQYGLFASSLKCLETVLRLDDTAGSASTAGAAFNPAEQVGDDEMTRCAKHNLVFALLEAALIADAATLGQATPETTYKTTSVAPTPAKATAAAAATDGGDVAPSMPVPPAVPAAAKHTVQPPPVPTPAAKADATASTSTAAATTATSLDRALQVLVEQFRFKLDPRGRCVASEANLNRLTPYVTGHTATYNVSVEQAAACVRVSLFLICQQQGIGAPSVLARLVQCANAVPESSAASTAAGPQSTAALASAFARAVVASNSLGPIVFVAPELGKWSTVGGLGVMVDELTVGLAALGADVAVVSPFYQLDRKGRADYLKGDGIVYSGKNVGVHVGGAYEECGVHVGRVKGVQLFFLHHPRIFPKPYPAGDARAKMTMLVTFAKATLETLCQFRVLPGLVVTNDWFAGLVPGYARHGHFGTTFQGTIFMHIAHNLDPSYEGRQYPSIADGTLDDVHGLPRELLVDPYWGGSPVINPTRAALLASNSWATVSRSYRQDLLNGSPMSPLLRMAPQPFAHPNGIPAVTRSAKLDALPDGCNTHEGAKAALQRKYFHMDTPDMSIPMFGFVGRITQQKGVHLILGAVDELLGIYGGRVQFIVGGMASSSDSYGARCATAMRDLARRHPGRFWADPTAFFTDGPLVNLGCDFGMMPSLFEPGGIVQQEFFVAGSAVIAFKTGGLRDTVHEFDATAGTGNGMTFEAHTHGDFVFACRRAVNVFSNPTNYAKLRKNARESVVDLSVVCRGWYEEFCRLRHCLVSQPTIRFFWVAGDMGSTRQSRVQLVASFLGSWTEAVALEYDSTTNEFAVSLPVPTGTHEFKFIVDGVWQPSPHVATMKDSGGHINNVVTVADNHL